MRSTLVWVLVLINLLLLAGLIGRVSRPNAALAQNRPAPARPGDYLMIPGEVTGMPAAVVYMIDITNGQLGAMVYNDTMKRLEAMPGKIDLAAVFSEAAPAQPEGNKRVKR
ncbi:MAG: hypothetical protein NZ561_00025 [Phycisphaerae bacterium]|nr:hypothetical protein [Phycisphaerae bacterium]MDW8263413.1 hypothetical protein [Phycisphaerales bacterium]